MKEDRNRLSVNCLGRPPFSASHVARRNMVCHRSETVQCGFKHTSGVAIALHLDHLNAAHPVTSLSSCLNMRLRLRFFLRATFSAIFSSSSALFT